MRGKLTHTKLKQHLLNLPGLLNVEDKALQPVVLQPDVTTAAEEPVLQQADSPAQLIAEELGAFNISQALARKLLCRNSYGEPQKENASGNHAVIGYGGIHFKPNPEGRDYIAPGIEYAMYSLHQEVQPDCIAPTLLIKLRNVKMKKVIVTPEQADYRIYKQLMNDIRNTEQVLQVHPELNLQFETVNYERAIQAGLTIKGISLQDLLNLLQSVDFLKTRLGDNFLPALQALFDGSLVQRLLQDYPKLAQANAKDLLEAFTGFMMGFERGEQITDFQDWVQRPLIQRQKQFEGLAKNPHTTLQVYSLIRTYPHLMANQSLAGLLEIPCALKLMRQLYPQASAVELGEHIPKLWEKLDKDNFSGLFISSLLCNPTDGKADNFMVRIVRDEQHQPAQLFIIGIDNDKAFAPGISRRENNHVVQVKQVLYLFPQMEQPLAEGIRQRLLNLSPEQFIANWLTCLHQQNQRYQTLLPILTHGESLKGRDICQIEDASDYALLDTGNIPICLSPGLVLQFYAKLKQLKQQLLTQSTLTHRDLFQAIEPVIARYYQAIQAIDTNPLDALESIYNDNSTVESLLATELDSTLPGVAGNIAGQTTLRSHLERIQDKNEDYEENRHQTIEAALAEWIKQIDWNGLESQEALSLINQLGQLPLQSISLSVNKASAWLRAAVAQGLHSAVKLLLASHADANQAGEVEQTALHLLMCNFVQLAHIGGDETIIDIAKSLLAYPDIAVDTWDNKGYTPLSYLLEHMQEKPELAEQLARLLVKHGADCEREDKETGKTPLELSMSQENITTFCLLVHLGAGRRAEPGMLIAFIENQLNLLNIEAIQREKLQAAQHQLAQQNALFAWQLSLRRLTQITAPTSAEINQHCKEFSKDFKFEIEGALSGKCYLRPKVVSLLFNTNGSPKKSNHQYGRRPVVYLEDNDLTIHVKFYPELPGVEEAVQVLSQQLFGTSLVPSELFRFIDPKGEAYPVLISQHVPGVKLNPKHYGNVQEFFNHCQNMPEKINEYFDKLDSKSFSELLLLTLLTNPEDGKPDNFVLQPYINEQGENCYRLVGVDNDHAFVAPIIRNSDGQKELQVKTLVYCLSQMEQSLQADVIAAFLKLDPLNTLRRWLEILKQRQTRYEQLFCDLERESLLQRGKSWFGGKDEYPVVIPIPFAPKSVVNIYEKFITLQHLLGKQSNIKFNITGLDLLRRTIPFVGLRYQAAFKQIKDKATSQDDHAIENGHQSNPSARFHHVASILYSSAIAGNYGVSVTGRQLLKTSNISEEQLLQAQSPYSPAKARDELELAFLESNKLGEVKFYLLQKGNLKPFQQLLLNSSREKILESIDFAPLSQQLQKKILAEALRGISFFKLNFMNCPSLTNTQLIKLIQTSPNLRELHLEKCIKITEKFLPILAQECQALEKFTLADLPKLTRLEVGRSLTSLRFSETPLALPQLQQLTLINLPKLSTWLLQLPQLKKLQLDSCPLMTQMQMHTLIVSTPQLEALKLIQCPQLDEKSLLKMLLCQHQQWTVSYTKPFIEGETLNLKGLPITDKSLAAIVERQLPIKHLDIRGCKITDEELLALMRHERLTQVRLCDYAAKGQCETTLRGHTSNVYALAVLPDGRIVSGSYDCTLRIWDAKSNQCLTLAGFGPILALAVLPDGRIVSSSYFHTLRIWDAVTGHCVAILNDPPSDGDATALAILPDGRIASGCTNNTLRIWNSKSYQCLAILKGHTRSVRALAVLPDGRIISGSEDKTLRVWDSKFYQCLAILKGHTFYVFELAILPDGRIVSGAGDQTLRIWDAESYQCLATLQQGHTYCIHSLAVFPDGRIASGCTDNILRIWDSKSYQCLATLQGHTNFIVDLAILPDGHIVSGSWDHTLRVWSFPDLVLDYTSLQALKGKCTLVLNQMELCLTVSPVDASMLKPACETLRKVLRSWEVSIDMTASTLSLTFTDSVTAYRYLKHLQALRPVSMSCHTLPGALTDTDIENWVQQKWPLTEVNLPVNIAITSKGLQRLISHLPTLQKLECSSKHLDLLLLDKLQPQFSQHDNQLELYFDDVNSLFNEERQHVINTYQNVIQLCFELIPSAESNSLCLIYHCPDASQLADSIKKFFSSRNITIAKISDGKRVTINDIIISSLVKSESLPINPVRKIFKNPITMLKHPQTCGNELELDVPSDNSCLYWSAALAYLIPVQGDRELFNRRYEDLFGEDKLIHIDLFYSLIKNYNPYTNLNPDQSLLYSNEITNRLITETFRSRVINYIAGYRDQFEQFYANENSNDQRTFNDYLAQMQDSNSWGGDLELKAISSFLNINVYRESINAPNDTYTANSLDTISIIHVARSDDRNGVGNHYHYRVDINIFNTPQSNLVQAPSTIASSSVFFPPVVEFQQSKAIDNTITQTNQEVLIEVDKKPNVAKMYDNQYIGKAFNA